MQNNPYIGPRPFERSDRDRFFGRARETRDLLSLIMAERVVLFYAQSGAGKTSLLNTQIVPALEEEGFNVLPIARVGSELPRGVDAASVKNIFVFSALLELAGPQSEISLLHPQTLKSFLASAIDDEHPPIIIFDQFEEILTMHRERWEDARGFFEQLRDALQAVPKLGVVLAMREDHVAGLDPHANLLPKRLKTRFRMELLGYDGALEAVRKPAQNAGCAYGTGVAERLVDDLRRIQVTANTGSSNGALGPYVELVQLQVVCSRLWDKLPEREEHIITWPEIEQFGNIDRALTDFYESALQHTAQETSVTEGQLRRWFSTELITPMKTRGPALRGERDTNGLPNEAVDVLNREHLIRAEARAGAYWYELAHDRLVDPIVNSNAAYEQERTTTLRITAQEWQKSKSADLLYGGSILADAIRFTETHPADVEDYEREFLEASVQEQHIRARNRKVRLTATAILAFALLLTAGLAMIAMNATRESIREKHQAQSGQLAAQAQVALDSHPQRSVLLALEAISVTTSRDEATVPAAEQALRDVQSTVGGQGITVSPNEVRAVAVSPDGRWLAHGGAGVQVHDLVNAAAPPLELPEANGMILALAFSRSGKLASSSFDGTVRVWDSTYWSKPPVELSSSQYVEQNLDFQIGSVAISPDDRWLAAGDAAGVVRLWQLNDLAASPQEISSSNAAVRSVVFTPDSRFLIICGENGDVRVAEVATPAALLRELRTPTGAILNYYSLALSPDGETVAAAGDDHLVIWQTLAGLASPIKIPVLGDSITAVAFSPDGQYLAAAGLNGKVYIWENQVFTPDAKPLHTLTGHEDAIYQLAFSPDSRWLFSASRDHTVRRWHLDKLPDTALARSTVPSSGAFPFLSSTGRYLILYDGDDVVRLLDLRLPDPIAEPVVLRDAPLRANHLVMSDDEHWLAALSSGGSPRLWDLTQPSASPIVLAAPPSLPSSLDFTADGRWLIGTNDQAVYLWNTAQPTTQPLNLAAEGENPLAHAGSPDGRWLATVGTRSGLRLWDLTMNEPSAMPIPLQSGITKVTVDTSSFNKGVSFSPDGRWLLAVVAEPPKEQRAVWVWDMLQLPQISAPRVLSFKEGENFAGYAFSPQNHWLLVLSDEAAYAWDVTSPDFAANSPQRFETGSGNVGWSIAMSPDERWLAIGGSDKSTRLWATSNLSSTPQILLGQNVPVSNLSFSPDSQWLATSGPWGAGSGGYYELPKRLIGSTVLLWNLAQPQLAPVVLHGGVRFMTTSDFSPDGQWLITYSDHGTQLWDMSLDRLSIAACAAAGRNFTRLEWSQYFPDQPYRKTCDQWPLEDSSQ